MTHIDPPSPGYLLTELGFIDETEAAVALDITTETLVGYRKAGTGPCFAVLARRILYSRAALADWLNRGGCRDSA
jgi:hypothetical protein